MIYKAKNFKRDYEATSIQFRETEGPIDLDHWEPSTAAERDASGARPIFETWENGHETTCFGWM